jgi:chondroitin 4-sulfotransferase 11
MHINSYRKLVLLLQEENHRSRAARYRSAEALYDLLRLYHGLTENPYRPVQHATHSIYVHVPKTGGTSIARMIYDTTSKAAGSHRAAWEYRNYSRAWFDAYFTFAAVRHPLVRLHSAFYYLKAGGKNRKDRRWAENTLAPYDDFRSFVRALAREKFRRKIMRWIHFVPQSYFLCDERRMPIVDYVFPVERFETGMRKVCERLNLRYAPRHDNATPARRVCGGDFSEFAMRLCHEMYRQDYELLRYPIDPRDMA